MEVPTTVPIKLYDKRQNLATNLEIDQRKVFEIK